MPNKWAYQLAPSPRKSGAHLSSSQLCSFYAGFLRFVWSFWEDSEVYIIPPTLPWNLTGGLSCPLDAYAYVFGNSSQVGVNPHRILMGPSSGRGFELASLKANPAVPNGKWGLDQKFLYTWDDHWGKPHKRLRFPMKWENTYGLLGIDPPPNVRSPRDEPSQVPRWMGGYLAC